MGEDAAAVDALPPERVVREAVDLAPRHLLGQEPGDPGLAQDLRQRGAVAEHVWQPQVGGLPAELLDEEALAVDDLAHQGLARRDVAVGLHPHAADRLELAAFDLLPDALVEAGVTVLDPRVLLGLGAGEAVLRVLVHQPYRVGERPGALAGRLPQRPQPGGVDVGVAHGADAVGAGRGRALQRGRQRGARRRCGGGNVVHFDGVARRREGAQHMVRPRLLGWELVQQLGQHEHVVVEGFDVTLGDGELGLPEPVDRRAVDVGHEQRPAKRSPRRDGVGRRLHVQLDWLASGRRPRDEVLAVAEMDPLHRHVALPHQALRREPHHAHSPEVEERDHLGARPVARDLSPHAEPRGVPGPAPRPAHGEGLVAAGVGLLRRDGLAVHVVGSHLQGRSLTVDGWPDELLQHLVDARSGYAADAAVLQHERVASLPTSRPGLGSAGATQR